jgi:hypothetical protein
MEPGSATLTVYCRPLPTLAPSAESRFFGTGLAASSRFFRCSSFAINFASLVFFLSFFKRFNSFNSTFGRLSTSITMICKGNLP